MQLTLASSSYNPFTDNFTNKTPASNVKHELVIQRSFQVALVFLTSGELMAKLLERDKLTVSGLRDRFPG